MTSRDEPSRADRFAFPGWRVEDGRLVFAFDCSRYGAFEEMVWFPDASVPSEPDEGLSRLIDLLHVALGVSTYKAAAARRVALPPLTPGGRAMAERLYTEGLAEFFVRAGLGYPPGTAFEGEALVSGGSGEPSGDGALVAFGGGKDSYVARAIAEEAGDAVTLCSVVMSDAVEAAITATAPEPVTFLRRSLDPKLLALTDAFGGHVPITAINALVLTIYAWLTGRARVVFANERSADEPTMDVDGVVANHQDSKSSGFERLLADAVRQADPSAPVPFSALRAYSELWIARSFASLKDGDSPLPRFTSCNRNFRLAGDADRRWCGACAKCAFTSLLLSPHLSEAEHEAAFGGQFLDRLALQPYFEQLAGLTETKPWDCVGTIDECRATLWRLSRGVWADSEAVRTLLPRVLAVTDEAALAAAWDEGMTAHDAPLTPLAYHEAAARRFV